MTPCSPRGTASSQRLWSRSTPCPAKRGCGFTPSPESYAVSVEQLERARAWFARNDLGAPGALDLFTSLVGGLAGQQIANDPGGDHWVQLVDTAVDMFLTYIQAAGQATTRRTGERTRS